ncbi:TraB/GumN family protein [Hymenobacter crusticola]|uniref:Erythromycin esterase n=1 Tax=Hymenobacter crusticola TaxID=1770526 RepID=A0A243WEY8_9BACT|nr:hypothetical protein [Hymenobacter crusticola]OUJ74050.1 hypothetical protein BXP70_09890 [Hymenobacter crusticola]
MKKFLKALLILFLLLIVGVPLLALGGYALYGLAARGSESTENIQYLAQHKEVLTTATPETFALLDETFYQNQIFLLGESHGTAAPQDLDFALLKHLNAKVGLRNYIAEIDPSQAYYFNQYLQTGDERNLRVAFQPWLNTAQWGNVGFYNKLKRIYALNESLPDSAKIRFIGLDRLQDLGVTRQRVQALLQAAQYKAGAAAQLDTLQQLLAAEPASEEALSACARRLEQNLGTTQTYQRQLGTQYADFAHLVRNLTYLQPRVRRDSVLLLNLQAEYHAKHLGREKMYGLWGVYHVLQGPINKTLPFAALLKKSPLPFHDKVVSMPIFSLESETLLPTGALPASVRPATPYVAVDWVNQQGPLVFVKGLKDLAKVAPEHAVTLFKLDAADSPYRHSRQLLDIKAPLFGQNMSATKPDAVATDYAQYAFLVRGSKALEPLAKQ